MNFIGKNFTPGAYLIALTFLIASGDLAAQGTTELCGGKDDKLWAWAWAGANGEHVTTEAGDFGKPIITFMADLSGNERHYFNPTPTTPQSQPGYEPNGLTRSGSWGTYTTDLPVVGLEKYNDGTEIWVQSMLQDATLVSDGEFYLAFAGMDTRGDGRRFIWGQDRVHSVRFHQETNHILITINGVDRRLSANYSVPNGPILIEVWREASGALHVWANGSDITDGNPTDTSRFEMTGIGGPLGDDSALDDYAFEYIACDALPTQPQRAHVREYLREKWNLYEATDVLRPNPPENLTAEQG